MLVLVVQVLIGFDYKAIFEAKFVELPVLLQYLKLFSLAAQLITLMLLLAIPSYHRIAEQGENSAYFCRVIKGLMAIALFPFAFSFGAEFAIPGLKAFGSIGSVVLPTTVALFAYFFWHGFPMLMRTRNGHKTMKKKQAVTLSDKIKQTLTEARVVLPGTQALLGFQLIIFLSHSFDQLPKSSQLLHLGALGCVGASAILLMTPPAYHRIAEDGDESEGFQILTSRFLVAAMAFLAAGVAALSPRPILISARSPIRLQFFGCSLRKDSNSLRASRQLSWAAARSPATSCAQPNQKRSSPL